MKKIVLMELDNDENIPEDQFDPRKRTVREVAI
jgi:hypothetical protein